MDIQQRKRYGPLGTIVHDEAKGFYHIKYRVTVPADSGHLRIKLFQRMYCFPAIDQPYTFGNKGISDLAVLGGSNPVKSLFIPDNELGGLSPFARPLYNLEARCLHCSENSPPAKICILHTDQ